MPHGDLDALARVIGSLVDAVEQGRASLVTAGVVGEDMPVIAEQVVRAAATVEEIKSGAAPDAMHVLLHRLNNQLTGVLSLTMLTREDLPAGHASAAALLRVETFARDAALIVKRVGATLKAES